MMSKKETIENVFSQHQSNVGEPGLSLILRNRHTRFPEVLHDMIKSVEKDGLSHIISWQPHGRCIMVHQPEKFVEQILPHWFHQSKWTSFQRQLNIYGFLRMTSGLDKGAYYHPLFLRGKEASARDIPRVSVKGHGHHRPVAATIEPNFYQMPFLAAPSTSSVSLSMTSDHHARSEPPHNTRENLLNQANEFEQLSPTSSSERVIAQRFGGMDTNTMLQFLQNRALFNSLATLRPSASMPQISTTMGLPLHTRGGLLSHSNIQSLLLTRNYTNSVHRLGSGLVQLLESRSGLTSSSSTPTVAMSPSGVIVPAQNWQFSATSNAAAHAMEELTSLRCNVPILSTPNNMDLRLLLAMLRRNSSDH